MQLTPITRQQRLLLYGAASLAVHAGLLAVVLGSARNEPTYHEIPVSFKQTVASEAVAEPGLEAKPAAGAPVAATEQATASPSGGSTVESRPRPSARASGDLLALATADLSSLRASVVYPSPASPVRRTDDGDTATELAPADPPIHLTPGAIERLVNQPQTGAAGGGGGGWGGVQVGMGGGGGCK